MALKGEGSSGKDQDRHNPPALQAHLPSVVAAQRAPSPTVTLGRLTGDLGKTIHLI